MIPCTFREIAGAVGGELLQDTPAAVEAVNTDSRKAAPGQLFVPLVGERFDGHDYLAAALASGAAGCLTARRPETMIPGKGYVLVEDTLRALQALAAWYRGRFAIPFVQVTGSAGKTTTKEMIASVLSRRFRTHKTFANLNNPIGTPLTLLEMGADVEAAVIETGMDRFGQIRTMGAMVRPDFAVITNVGDAHIENLGNTRQGTLRAKSEIFENLQPDGVAVLNGDDELLRNVALQQRILFCGRGENCSVRVSDVEERGIDGLRCTVTTGRGVYHIRVTTPGAYMIYPAAMAVAIGEELGLTAEEIEAGVAAYEPVGARMRVLRLPGERIVIDDCYNANPQSMQEALQLLSRTPARRRLAVLGDMNELGELTAEAHRQMGALAGELHIDAVVAVGEKARDLAAAAPEGTIWRPDAARAIPAVRELFAPGTAALVKASHSMAFEQITAALRSACEEESE